MRQCEKELKRRGINVYPALIPSMQKLAARGIRLAASLRSLDIPVIQSYPSAAQDIMGIPRKRASLEMLRQGLGEFGVTGNYQYQKVTHDELDAITSSIVGLFFWSGWYESLGAGADEALIIPHLRDDTAIQHRKPAIGISSLTAAGKTTAAEELKSLGYSYFRYSKVLEDILRNQGEIPGRARLQSFGEEVHIKFGQRWLGNELLSWMEAAEAVVIDGLRFPEDHAFWVEQFGPWFKHVYISADASVRADRFRERDRDGNPFNIADDHPAERRAVKMEPLSHLQISNENTIHSYRKRIRKLASNLLGD
ncbi:MULTISPECIES: AAA family ATPase [unclassified Synechococcus]|uniref:AAA family ATPase n=1 Tax=unclassified Synechococcus TaxID=2626047 RepID=UPI0021A586DE|nr:MULTISPECIES: AAA family ATPase [unclassified Synechococcus]